jgi:hypothetical protein
LAGTGNGRASWTFSVLLRCVWDFLFAGRGTLAPFDPPKLLVVRGLYRLAIGHITVRTRAGASPFARRRGSEGTA